MPVQVACDGGNTSARVRKSVHLQYCVPFVASICRFEVAKVTQTDQVYALPLSTVVTGATIQIES